MSFNPVGSAGNSLPTNQDSKTQPKLATDKEPDKATKVFKKALTPEEEKSYWDNEREYYVNSIMEKKGVSREVAESQYDFLN